MDIGYIIKTRRLELGLTLEQVGKAVGVGKSTVRKWESGQIKDMRRDKIAALADALSISPTVLIFGVSEEFLPENVSPLPRMKRIPLLGDIACGQPILAEENIVDYVNMPVDFSGTFALRCHGDSMINARIFDGDLVYIHQQPVVENGEIAAVLIDNEATLKRVYRYSDRIELRAENPTFRTITFVGEEMVNVSILGKAIAFTSFVQ